MSGERIDSMSSAHHKVAVIRGATLGFFVGLAITAASVYAATRQPVDPRDPSDNGAMSPLLGVFIIPVCSLAFAARALNKATAKDNSRSE
jgi:hypothetical protein